MRKKGDRAWYREIKPYRGRRRWQVIVVRAQPQGEEGPRQTWTTYSEAEAKRDVRILQAAIEESRLDAPVTWERGVELFLEYRERKGDRESTRKTYEHSLKAVERTLGDPDPLTLTVADGLRHIAARQGEGRSARTINRELNAVAEMQRLWVRREWIPRVTWESDSETGVPRLEVLSTRRELRQDEIGLFMRAAARLEERFERWTAYAWLMLHGLRRGELAGLRVEDLDLVGGHVHVRDRQESRTKSSSSTRVVPVLSEEALRCLQRTFRDVPKVLTQPDGKQRPALAFPGARTNKKYATYRTTITCAEAEIPRRVPHELRHTVATAAITAGADASSVQALLGHSDVRTTTSIYSHATSAARAAGAARTIGGYLDRVVRAAAKLEAV